VSGATLDQREFERIINAGEGTSIEFKRCGGQPGPDTFETICSFANHTGGNIFLGVADDGTVVGVPEKASLNIQRYISNTINNSEVFKPAVALEFDAFTYKDKQVIRIWIPFDAFVHSYKGTIFDRSVDSDIALKLDSQISALYLRKQFSYTEQTIYPYVSKSDLKLELLKEAKQFAREKRNDHPWNEMTDEELLKSAGLFAKDYITGKEGFNLAAVLLLGKEHTIASILPAYKTDAILRIDDTERYDDRLTVKSNLIEAYSELDSFCKRYVKDRFFLENGRAISPRDIIVRELISNTLIHREYSSPFPARIIITAEEITTENGSKAFFDGPLDLSSFNPMPKNPLIARFFNQIGRADELGSGVKNLLRYSKAYSGEEPTLIEGNVFKASVPLTARKAHISINPAISEFVEKTIDKKGYVTTVDVREGLRIDHKAAQRELAKLVELGIVHPIGNTRARKYLPNK